MTLVAIKHEINAGIKEANNEKTWREIAEKATKQRDEYRDALKTIQATMKEMIKVRVEA